MAPMFQMRKLRQRVTNPRPSHWQVAGAEPDPLVLMAVPAAAVAVYSTRVIPQQYPLVLSYKYSSTLPRTVNKILSLHRGWRHWLQTSGSFQLPGEVH